MTRPVTITIPHQLGKAEARRRIEEGFGQITQNAAGAQLGRLQQAWSGDRLSFSAAPLGQRLAGRLDVEEREIKIEVDLPPLLAGFADAISGKLKREGTLLLEKK